VMLILRRWAGGGYTAASSYSPVFLFGFACAAVVVSVADVALLNTAPRGCVAE